MGDWLPAAGSDFGKRVRERIESELVIWYTSVRRDGTPLPNPVWFVLDGEEFLIYNRPTAARVHGLPANPRVALHFNSTPTGGDIVVVLGTARPAPDAPPCNEHAAYADKYGARMERISGSREVFARAYPVAIRVGPDRLHD
ncbi:MAG TPA: TIGR03667 family PPOX class F420-dependent oxidoreductase [Candidatus Dormibacteraeota bacterium]